MADVATGITIVFGTSGFSAEIIDVTPIRATREAIDDTHQGTTNTRTSIPADLVDPGQVRFTIAYNPSTEPPMHAALEVVTITHPDGTTQVFNGFMINYEAEEPLDQKLTGSVELQIADEVVFTPGDASGTYFI